MSPLTVLSDPARLAAILKGEDGGLHEDAAYIYRKQLEESDIILITKIDTLTPEALEPLKAETYLCGLPGESGDGRQRASRSGD